VKGMALLLFMLGATETTSGPEVAPAGIVMVIEVLLQELMVTGAPFSVTRLLPCGEPNPVPEITTWLPTGPVVADTLLITGAGAAAEFTETLSKVAVASAEVLLLHTANPMYTFWPMGMVWLVPMGVQFTPSAEVNPLMVLPLRVNFTQDGRLPTPTVAWPVLPPVVAR